MIVQSTMRPANKLLFEFQLHTLTRSRESTGARWGECSFEEQIWYLPAELLVISAYARSSAQSGKVWAWGVALLDT